MGGGVRALSLCLFTAALLAVYILDAKLRAVYTMAEHSERVVEVDLRPVLYVRSLRDSRSSAKRSFLAELASAGEAELERYEKRLLREFAEYGMSDGTSLTSAGAAFSKILSLWEARRLQLRRLPRR
ncbi:hypothetical protein [Pyrobaculum ferrireducens]|uniref:hypothetical protein n=1 Tax=Pyrobaculum ferrireducens TaxID=1104324 RepID=UPI000ABDD506|nr:hypothetical protein [Pyrobaculum ferrireducens]